MPKNILFIFVTLLVLLVGILLYSQNKDSEYVVQETEQNTPTLETAVQHSESLESLLEAIANAHMNLFVCKFNDSLADSLADCSTQYQIITDVTAKANIAGLPQDKIKSSAEYGKILGERASRSMCKSEDMHWTEVGCYLNSRNLNELGMPMGYDQRLNLLNEAFDREVALGKETPVVFGSYDFLYQAEDFYKAEEYVQGNCRLYRRNDNPNDVISEQRYGEKRYVPVLTHASISCFPIR